MAKKKKASVTPAVTQKEISSSESSSSSSSSSLPASTVETQSTVVVQQQQLEKIPATSSSDVSPSTTSSPSSTTVSSSSSSKPWLGEWDLISHSSVSGGIFVEKYTSRRTGLRVVRADIAGPLVSGYLTLATESHCDDGCPHTLEHLVFMGSEKYPYKGVLDQLANRNFSQGTNAWTDTDHTAYTLDTVGEEGFLNLLPVYVDHILYPTITEASFVTEVHHITGEGQNAGVVYCEMQARENTGESILNRKLLTHLYPGHCGYKSETGGMLHDIRQLNVETIRKYHQDYYRPENLCLIVAGKLDEQKLFQTLNAIEESILAHPANKVSYARPWTSPVPEFTQSVVEEIPYPSEDEDVGMVYIGWRGPNWTDFMTRTALTALWNYLTVSSISTLQKHFIEIETPYCGGIEYDMTQFSSTMHVALFQNVTMDKLKEVHSKFFEVMKALVDEGIDLQRMKSVILKEKRNVLNNLEESPHASISRYAVYDFLYGDERSQTQFAESMDQMTRLDWLEQQPASYWTDLINEYFINRPHVCLIGTPSKAASEKQMADEEERVQKQIERLSAEHPQRLQQLEEYLQKSIAANSILPPDEVLSTFPIPDVTRIKQIPLFTIRSGESTDLIQANNQHHPDFQNLFQFIQSQSTSLADLPFWVQMDHIPSSFVQIKWLLDCDSLPTEYKLYLPLFREMLYELPIRGADGSVIPVYEVIDNLERDAVSYSQEQGFGSGRFNTGSFGQFVVMSMKFDQDQYTQAIKWAQELTFNTVITLDRVLIAIKRLLADIPQRKNNGSTIVKAGSDEKCFDEDAVEHAVGFIRQQAFLKDLYKRLKKSTSKDHEKDEDVKDVITVLHKLRDYLCNPQRIRVHVSADFTKQSQLIGAWQSFLPEHLRSQTDKRVIADASDLVWSYRHRIRFPDSPIGYIVSVPACESGYMYVTSELPNLGYEHSDICALRTLLEYITALEGPMWKRIRGLGLSYSYSMNVLPESNTIRFSLFKSTNLPGAYEEAEKIIQELLAPSFKWNLSDVSASKSSLVYEFYSRSDTITSAAERSLIYSLMKVRPGHDSRLLADVFKVTADDLTRVLIKYVAPLFKKEKSFLICATSPTNIPALKNKFKGKRPLRILKKVKKLFDGSKINQTNPAASPSQHHAHTHHDSSSSSADRPCHFCSSIVAESKRLKQERRKEKEATASDEKHKKDKTKSADENKEACDDEETCPNDEHDHGDSDHSDEEDEEEAYSASESESESDVDEDVDSDDEFILPAQRVKIPASNEPYIAAGVFAILALVKIVRGILNPSE